MFSNIEVKPLNSQNGSKIVGVGNLLVNENVQVSFTISESRNGLFVKLPQHKGKGKDKDGNLVDRWYNDVRFPNKENYNEFQRVVLEAYNAAKGGSTGQEAAGEEPQATHDDNPF